MCQFGEDGCSGSWSNTTINNRFKFCCRKKPSFENMTMYNGHNESYIGCRCVNDTIPTNTDPDAYVVPQTGLFNSTGGCISLTAFGILCCPDITAGIVHTGMHLVTHNCH